MVQTLEFSKNKKGLVKKNAISFSIKLKVDIYKLICKEIWK